MIVRTWRCRASLEGADAYHDYLTGTVFRSLSAIEGHRGAQLLRRETDGQIEFVAISYWDSVEAIKEYAGDNIEVAMVKPEARAMLIEFDEFVRHYELAYDTVGEKP